MELRELVLQVRVEAEAVDEWVEAGWLAPGQNGSGRHFSVVDLARAHLIRDLQAIGVNDEGIPIILDLVDQLHGLRGMLRELLTEIKSEWREHRRK